MSQAVKFGFSVPSGLAIRDFGPWQPDDMVEVVQRAESLGFDIVSVADHIFLPEYLSRGIGNKWIDPFAVLDFLAARTSRIRLMINCLVVPYRQPFGVAKWAATLDQLSQGRFILGVVPGYLKEEFDAFKLPLDERGAMTDEFIQIMQALWTSNDASFHGKYYDFAGIDIFPKCAQQPHLPIWVGGKWRRSVRRAVELGSGWVPVSAERRDAIRHKIEDPGDEVGHRYAEERLARRLPTNGTTLDDLRNDVAYAKEYAEQIGRPFDLDVMPLLGRQDASRPQDIVIKLQQHVDAGATGFFVDVSADSVPEYIEGLERFAREVMPTFSRAETGRHGKVKSAANPRGIRHE